jgi:hypothetical protein
VGEKEMIFEEYGEQFTEVTFGVLDDRILKQQR